MAPIIKLSSILLTARQYPYNAGPSDPGLPGPAIAGIVVSVSFFLIIFVSIIVRRRRYGNYYSQRAYYEYPQNRPNAQGVWGANSGNQTYPPSEFGPGNPSPMRHGPSAATGDLQPPPPMYSRSAGGKNAGFNAAAGADAANTANANAASNAAAASAAAASSSAGM